MSDINFNKSTKLGRWLRDRPRFLERIYIFTHWVFERLGPLFERLGYAKVESVIRPAEEFAKRVVFDCSMCGQCVLHVTGMTCPMTCPKNLRNGPCGGVRENGNCEIVPEMRCVWVEAYERSLEMPVYGHEMNYLQPPVNRQLEGRSAWITLLSEEDRLVTAGWVDVAEVTTRS
jgi:hypothetical protein